MVHTCPVCKSDLTGKIYDGVTFSECPQCAGVWFFEDDLKHLESENVDDLKRIDLMDVPVKPAVSSDEMACPMCNQPMARFHFVMDNSILLARCSTCRGIWFDHGELTKVADVIRAKSRPLTQQEIAQTSKAEADIILKRNVKPAVPRVESEVERHFDAEHAATMARYQAITTVCKMLSTRINDYGGGWW